MTKKTLDFIIVGTAKAGTTHVYETLKQHPDLWLPLKETFYFMDKKLLELGRGENNNPYQDIPSGDGEYWSLFSERGTKKWGEVGTGYLYNYEHSISHIRQLSPDAKIVIILRNPVSRCYSGFMHFVKNAMEPFSFEESLKAEKERIDKGFSFMWHYQAMSFYAESVKAYHQAFQQVKVLFFEEMVENSDSFFEELYEFLGVRNLKLQANRTNASGVPKSKLLQATITQPNKLKHALRPIFRTLVPLEKRKQTREWFKRRNLSNAPKMDQKIASELRKTFSHDVTELELFLNRHISSWHET